MPQLGGLFRADMHAESAADALIMGIFEDTKSVMVIKFEGFGGTVFHTGGTAHACRFTQTCSAKQKNNHNEHDLGADHMKIPEVVIEKRDAGSSRND